MLTFAVKKYVPKVEQILIGILSMGLLSCHGVRTKTHKLIYYWTKDAYEMFDIMADPTEQHNLLYPDIAQVDAGTAAKFEELKAEISRLQQEFKDDGQYADPATWPKGSSDGPFDNKQPVGSKSISEAIAASAAA